MRKETASQAYWCSNSPSWISKITKFSFMLIWHFGSFPREKTEEHVPLCWLALQFRATHFISRRQITDTSCLWWWAGLLPLLVFFLFCILFPLPYLSHSPQRLLVFLQYIKFISRYFHCWFLWLSLLSVGSTDFFLCWFLSKASEFSLIILILLILDNFEGN